MISLPISTLPLLLCRTAAPVRGGPVMQKETGIKFLVRRYEGKQRNRGMKMVGQNKCKKKETTYVNCSIGVIEIS